MDVHVRQGTAVFCSALLRVSRGTSMKRALWIVALWAGIVVFVLWAGNTNAATQPVYIVDRSDSVSVVAIQNSLPAFQVAVSQDFAPVWGLDAQLVVTDTPPAAGGETIYVEDWATGFGELGYHDFQNGHTFARVFAATTDQFGFAWQLVFTHELFEMLADPYVNRLALGTRLWAVEVCDPVEASRLGYTRPGADGGPVPISDFVTPAWYQRKGRAPFDFGQHVKRSGQLLKGGYAVYWSNGWHMMTNW